MYYSRKLPFVFQIRFENIFRSIFVTVLDMSFPWILLSFAGYLFAHLSPVSFLQVFWVRTVASGECVLFLQGQLIPHFWETMPVCICFCYDLPLHELLSVASWLLVLYVQEVSLFLASSKVLPLKLHFPLLHESVVPISNLLANFLILLWALRFL